MTNITEKYNKAKKKEAIGMLKSLAKKIENDEMEVDSFGLWQGLPGNWTLKIQVKESDKKPRF